MDFDKRAKDRVFYAGQPVMAKDFRAENKYSWVTEKLLKLIGKTMGSVQVGHHVWRRHTN